METSYSVQSVGNNTRQPLDYRTIINITAVFAYNAENVFLLNKLQNSTYAIPAHLVYCANKLSPHMQGYSNISACIVKYAIEFFLPSVDC